MENTENILFISIAVIAIFSIFSILFSKSPKVQGVNFGLITLCVSTTLFMLNLPIFAFCALVANIILVGLIFLFILKIKPEQKRKSFDFKPLALLFLPLFIAIEIIISTFFSNGLIFNNLRNFNQKELFLYCLNSFDINLLIFAILITAGLCGFWTIAFWRRK